MKLLYNSRLGIQTVKSRLITIVLSALSLGMFGMAATLPTSEAREMHQMSPQAVLQQFCGADAEGKQLTPDGSQEIAALFVSYTPRHRERIIVIKDFAVSEPTMRGSIAEFYVEYTSLGEIDTMSGRFSRLPPGKVRATFHLVLSDRRAVAGRPNTGRQPNTPPGWKIEGIPPEPHVNVESAIKYLTEMRSAIVANDMIKRNTDIAIATLNGLRPHS